MVGGSTTDCGAVSSAPSPGHRRRPRRRPWQRSRESRGPAAPRRAGVSRVQHALLDDRSAEYRLPRRSAAHVPARLPDHAAAAVSPELPLGRRIHGAHQRPPDRLDVPGRGAARRARDDTLAPVWGWGLHLRTLTDRSEAWCAARRSGVPSTGLVASSRPGCRRPLRGGPGRKVDTRSRLAGGVERGDRSRAGRSPGRSGIRVALERLAQGLYRAGAVRGILPGLRFLARCRRRVHTVTLGRVTFTWWWEGTGCRTRR